MAEFRILQAKTVANGTPITHETTVVDARDSRGRHMTATTDTPTSADQVATTHFRVFDPVAHVTFNWSFPGREATVMAIPFSGAISSGCSWMSSRIGSANEKTTVEELGTKTIQGVEARGRQTSTTVSLEPIGKHKKHESQAGTIEVHSTELWIAIDPGLAGLVVREVSKDWPSVETSRELVNFSQSEPDAAVFQPPIGYEVVNREVNTDACVSVGEAQPPAVQYPILPQPSER
jgi:hypothetical protein